MQKTEGSTVFSTLIMLISTKSVFFLSLDFFFWAAVHLGTVHPVIKELVHEKYYTFGHTATSFFNNSSPHANRNENMYPAKQRQCRDAAAFCR